MKKILLILLIIPLILQYCKNDEDVFIGTDRDPATGVGWAQQRAKVNFKDSINLGKGWMIKDTLILTSAKHFNFLRGVQSNVQNQINGKVNISDTANMLNPYLRSADISGKLNKTDTAAMLSSYLKGYDVTANLTAGALTDIATIRTVFPQSVKIFTSAGKDITSAVSDSLGLSGGVYHLYVYSVDALTNVVIKFSY